jgi:hypothetical protein
MNKHHVNWRKLEIDWSPEDIEFPALFAKDDTQQVGYWWSFDDMRSNESLFRLYTHWVPASEALPAPPPKPDPVKEAFEAWYNPFFSRNGYPNQLEIWRAGVVWGLEGDSKTIIVKL